MYRAATAPRAPGQPRLRGWRGVLALLLAWVACCAAALAQSPAAAPLPVEVQSLAVNRSAEGITAEYQLRVSLPRAVEDAALRGVPLYFRAEVELFKPRWYWRDDRVARAVREWRLSYQPLTASWRVSQAGIGQSFATLAEALATMTQASQWRVAEAGVAEANNRHYAEFSWRLDTSQLPRPLQIGVNSAVTGSDWAVTAEGNVKITASAPAVDGRK
jgi:Domain of unknown function (DUF4390)